MKIISDESTFRRRSHKQDVLRVALETFSLRSPHSGQTLKKGEPRQGRQHPTVSKRDSKAGARFNNVPRQFGTLIMIGRAILCLSFALPAFLQAQREASAATATAQQAGFAQEVPRDQSSPATLDGWVIDKSGAAIPGAKVTLFSGESSQGTEVISAANGEFSFPQVPAGPYRLTVSATGFGDLTTAGTLQAGEASELPPLLMAVAAVTSDVEVRLTKTELAQEQVKQQEEQRLLGFVPNFYVSYVPDAVPMTSKQKFQLAWKATLDPVTLGLTGVVAGVEQARNDYREFGQGAEGYAKRYGAAYGSFFTATMLAEAVLPSLFKQDPRYFYRGTGTTKSRLLYSISRPIIRKGDNGEWQPNYSGMIGRLAAGAISNYYYPAADRRGVGLTFENFAIGLGASAFANALQEFVFKDLTPKVAHRGGASKSPKKP
jgi:Carboxypeptidase regulatory-like domain